MARALFVWIPVNNRSAWFLMPFSISECVARSTETVVLQQRISMLAKKREGFLGDQSLNDAVSFRTDFSKNRNLVLRIWPGAAFEANRR